MVKGRRWVLKHHFVGEPKPEDFELVEEELPALQENEIQYRSVFLSVDPYMRPYTMRMSPPFTMIGSSVAVVEETRNPKFTVGQTIIILAGWVERGVVNPDKMGKDSPGNTLGGIMPAPDLGKLSKSLLLGSCGMPGNTAYFGFLELCAPRPGETGNNTISGMIILYPGRQSWSAAPRGPWAASWARSPRSRQEYL